MDQRVHRLVNHFDLTEEIATKLVIAGHDTPRKIKYAPDSILRLIPGVGRATVADIRKKIKPTSL